MGIRLTFSNGCKAAIGFNLCLKGFGEQGGAGVGTDGHGQLDNLLGAELAAERLVGGVIDRPFVAQHGLSISHHRFLLGVKKFPMLSPNGHELDLLLRETTNQSQRSVLIDLVLRIHQLSAANDGHFSEHSGGLGFKSQGVSHGEIGRADPWCMGIGQVQVDDLSTLGARFIKEFLCTGLQGACQSGQARYLGELDLSEGVDGQWAGGDEDTKGDGNESMEWHEGCPFWVICHHTKNDH